MGRWVVVVRLWSDVARCDMTPRPVSLAETVEQRLRVLHAAALPCETHLLCRLTPEAGPEHFG